MVATIADFGPGSHQLSLRARTFNTGGHVRVLNGIVPERPRAQRHHGRAAPLTARCKSRLALARGAVFCRASREESRI